MRAALIWGGGSIDVHSRAEVFWGEGVAVLKAVSRHYKRMISVGIWTGGYGCI
jgi:hypothetical protein